MEELDIQVSVKWKIRVRESTDPFLSNLIFGKWSWTIMPTNGRHTYFESDNGYARTQKRAIRNAKKKIRKQEDRKSGINIILEPKS